MSLASVNHANVHHKNPKHMGAGNMWGLLERTVAVECLGTVAFELKKSKADLQGLLPASEYSALETFFSRTVEAAGTSPLCILDLLYAPLIPPPPPPPPSPPLHTHGEIPC